MGTGWRRAFSATSSRDSTVSKPQMDPSPSPSPRSRKKLGFLYGGSKSNSNCSTPRLDSSPSLRCRTVPEASHETTPSLKLQCKTTTKSSKSSSLLSSNPSSPRSPLKLFLFKNSFKFRSSCGVCFSSVKTGHGTAIYTAECGHSFHFPCIAAHVRKHGHLVCPVCNTVWNDVPLLAVHRNLHHQDRQRNNGDEVKTPASKAKVEDKKLIVEKSTRAYKSSSKQDQVSRSPKLGDLKLYCDDEPLFSPVAGGKSGHIPEADENAHENREEQQIKDEEEEFQGFFANPKSAHSFKYASPILMNSAGDLRNIEIKLRPESAVISAGRTHQTFAVVLTVRAPPLRAFGSAPTRAPLDLVTVLDVSGSMTGAKLEMLKRAMRLVISSLGSSDRLSIVAFSATPKRLLPLVRMTAQGHTMARRIIDQLVCGQGTGVGDALRTAAKVLEDRRERNPVASIMLLSDGQDDRVQNAESQRSGSRHVSSTRFAHIEIPVLKKKSGSGSSSSYSYSHEPDAEDAFAKCIGGVLSVVVQDLRIELEVSSGSGQAEIAAVYLSNIRPAFLGSASIRVGDLYAEEEREFLVELKVPTSSIGSHHVMTVRCSYKDPASGELVSGKEHGLLVPKPHAVRSSLGPQIERLRNGFITTRAIAESRRLVEYGDYTSAYHMLTSARALLLQLRSASAGESVKELEDELVELYWRHRQKERVQMTQRRRGDELAQGVEGEPITPSSAYLAAEKLAHAAMVKRSASRVSDLHGFENARF